MMVIATLWENWNERVIEAAFLETTLFSQVWLTRFLTFSSSSTFCRLHSFYFFCFPQCHGLILASNLTPQNDSLNTCSGMENRIRIVKMRKLVDWDKNSLKGKGKAGHANKIRNSWTSSHQQVNVHLCPGKQGSITCNNDSGRKIPSLQMSPSSPSFFFPQIHILSMTSYSLEYPLGQLPQLFSLITSWAASLVGQDVEQKRLWGCVSSAQQ